MTNFKKWTEKEREKTLSNHITTELLVDRETLSFENIETELQCTDITLCFEVPPIIMDNKHLASVLAFAPTNDKGRWIRTMVRTYMEGGRVFYRQNDQDNFIATLSFK
ncbi:hypothetical protein V7S76_08585 [Aquirufa sp. ROCK2-A2]